MNNNKKCAFFLLPILAGDSVPALAEGFLEDSRASLALRNFYMNRDFRDGPGQSKREEGRKASSSTCSPATPRAPSASASTPWACSASSSTPAAAAAVPDCCRRIPTAARRTPTRNWA